MTRELGLVLTIAVVVVLGGLLVWAWRRRTRRDAQPLAPHGELPQDAAVIAEFDAFYVATTRHDEPLERLAAPGLGFRSRAYVVVSDAGVAIDLTGQERIVLPADRLVDVRQSTVAIDRVVEPGGLTRLTWRTLADTVVDTYLRPLDASARALADAIGQVIPPTGRTTPAPTGKNA